MAIKPTVPNHDGSPWYKIMEDKGKVWNEVANEVGAKINGFYNAYIVEFEMTQQVNSHQLRVYGKRELTAVNGRGIFSEVLSLQLRANDIDEAMFLKVGRSGLLNLLFNFSGKYKHKTSVNCYRIKYNSASVLKKVVKTKIFEIANINRLTVGPGGLSLEIQEIPMSVSTARTIRDFWKAVL